MLASESVGIEMVPGAGAGATATVRHNVWEELASSKTSALDAWRFEPSSMPEQSNSTADAWISHASRRDMQSLTLALQRELCSTNSNSSGNNFYNIESSVPQWKCKSESDVSSGSEAGGSRGGRYGIESPSRQQHDVQNNQNNALRLRGKVSKRRSRAANKTPITFLNADPANFRAMVQQVTGVPLNPNATRLWSPASGVAMPGLVKPEPKRPSSAAAVGGCGGSFSAIQGLPTLDTSALFIASSAAASAPRGVTSNSYTFAPPLPLIRASATPPQNDELLLTEKLRAALTKNGCGCGGGGGVGGCGGSGGFFVADQGQGMMNFAQEADSWFNNNPDGELIGSILL